jgi:DNA-directed RNA polymerase subunit RPC12/RpoP
MECRSDEEDIFICADCGDEIDPEELYEVDDEYLCKICVLCRFKISA